MSKYSTLKAEIIAIIKRNGAQAITGDLLQEKLLSMIDSLGEHYQFGGIAIPSTEFTPGDEPVVFIAATPGTYTNFGGLVVADGEVALLVWDGSAWSKQTTGIATRTEVSQLGQELRFSYEADADSDLDISDENGNVLARFARGGVETKEFSTEKTPTIKTADVDSDLDISDANGNVLARFKEGEFQTKKFNSNNIYIFANCVLYNAKANNFAGFEMPGWINNDGSISNNGNFGYSNMALLNTKEFAISGAKYIYDFVPSLNCVAFFGSKSIIRNAGNPNELISVDFENGTLNLHKGTTSYGITQIVKSESFTIDNYANKPFRVVESYEFRTLSARLYSLVDGVLLAEIQGTRAELTMDVKGDRPFVFSTDGNISVSNFIVSSPADQAQSCLIYICGDSITQGYWASEEKKSYGGLLRDALSKQNKAVVISGRSSADINGLLIRVPSEISALKPKYVMVTIGTNGGNTISNLGQLLQIIKNNGSIPILNHIPSPDSTRDSVNATIDLAISNYDGEIYCCQMDIAASVDYDTSLGMDASLFYDTDHPNDEGHKRMYERILIDCPFVFNF